MLCDQAQAERVKIGSEQSLPSYLSQICRSDKSLHILRAKWNIKGEGEAHSHTMELPFQNGKLRSGEEVFSINKWQRQFSDPSL